MFCPKCGSEMPDGSKFCGKCGAQIATVPGQGATGASGMPGASSTGPAQGAPQAPQGAPAAPGAPGASGTAAPRSKKGLIIGIVAVVAVVAVVIFGVTQCIGGNAHSSAEAVAESVESSFNRLVNDGFTSDAATAYADDMLNLMPSGVVDAVLDETGATREELLDELGSSLDFGEDIGEALNKIDYSVTVTVGDSLSESTISSFNSTFEEAGLSIEATNGYELDVTLRMTLKEDYSGSPAGTSHSETMSGLTVIQVDGSWYLWWGSM